jgi:hypothetical protein
VLHGQRGGSPTVLNLSFLDRSLAITVTKIRVGRLQNRGPIPDGGRGGSLRPSI